MAVKPEQYAPIYNGIFINPFPAKSYLMGFLAVSPILAECSLLRIVNDFFPVQ